MPKWFDLDFVRAATTGGVIGLGAAAVIVFVVVRSIVSKVLTIALIGALAFGFLTYRSSLDTCAKACSCKLGPAHITVTGHGCAAKR